MTEYTIKDIALFSSLPESELMYLTEIMDRIECDEGTVLIREGDRGDKFYIILAGQVEIIKSLDHTDEQILGKRGPADFFGEMSLLIPDGLRTAGVRTCTPVTLMELTRTDFDNLFQRRPVLAYELVRILSLRFRESENERIRDLQKKNSQLEQMYLDLLAAQAQIVEKEKLEFELNTAREIQQSILPLPLDTFGKFNFGARMEPARSIGGDFYDFMQLDEESVGIAIGDVSGKGIPAAIFMALFCSLLRSEAQYSTSPEEVLKRVNQHLLEMNKSRMFVTALFGIFNRKSREFFYARAGHETPILFDQEGNAKKLAWRQGQLLGIFEDPKLDEHSVFIPQGSTLLLYTDGVFDAWNATGTRFELPRLIETTAANVQASAQDICDDIIEELFVFQSKESQFDDITLVAIQSTPDILTS